VNLTGDAKETLSSMVEPVTKFFAEVRACGAGVSG
jgi:hypothetical protein